MNPGARRAALKAISRSILSVDGRLEDPNLDHEVRETLVQELEDLRMARSTLEQE